MFPFPLRQIRNRSTALTAARSSVIFRASSPTSSTCTLRTQSTRAKLAERAFRPNRTSRPTRRFTQVRIQRDQAQPVLFYFVHFSNCSTSHSYILFVLSQARGRSNAWCVTKGFGRRRTCKSTRQPTPRRHPSSARSATRHSATYPTSTRTWRHTVT